MSLSCPRCGIIGSVVDTECGACGSPFVDANPHQALQRYQPPGLPVENRNNQFNQIDHYPQQWGNNKPGFVIKNNYHPGPYREVKNPLLAATLSFFIPGLGQVYNGEVGKAAAAFFGTIFLFFFFFIGIGVYIWSIADAYATAKKINFGQA